MKKNIFYYRFVIICLLFISIQLQACQKKDILKKESEAGIYVKKNVKVDSVPNNNNKNPEYYDIENATIYCNGFDHSMAYKAFVIKIVDMKTQNATIQFEGEEDSELKIPHSFCDTLAYYLFRFYVKKDPIIVSKKETNVMCEQIISELRVKFLYRRQVFKDHRYLCKYDGGYIIEYSSSFMEFRDWIRYLCDQYYYNHNHPQNAYW